MAVHALVHLSAGLTRNRSKLETEGVSMMNSLRKNAELEDTIDRILCDGGDATARCSHCHTYSLNVNLLAVQKHFDARDVQQIDN